MNEDNWNYPVRRPDLDALPLFIMEEEYGEGDWRPVQFWLLTFRDVVDNYAHEHLCLPQFRVRRVKNWTEAKALEDHGTTRLQLPMLIHNHIQWVFP